MAFVPHVLPAPAQAYVGRLSDQQIVDGVRHIDGMPPARRGEAESLTRIWLVHEFENRHPEIDAQVDAAFDEELDHPVWEMEYIDVLAQFVPGVK